MRHKRETDQHYEQRLWAEALKEKPSKYGKFRNIYAGWNFKSLFSGKVYTKGEFWDMFRERALEAIDHYDRNILAMIKAPDGFLLVENPLLKEHEQYQKIVEDRRYGKVISSNDYDYMNQNC